jgi:hypothetical protein
MIKCWNCHTELDTSFGSPQNRTQPTAQSITTLLHDNIFDASRGTVLVNVGDLIDEIADLIVKHYE